jgi:hypothetical protein
MDEKSIYPTTLSDLARFETLLGIPRLENAIDQTWAAIIPAQLQIGDGFNVYQSLLLAKHLLAFFQIDYQYLNHIRSEDFPTYSRSMAFKHFLEKKFQLTENEAFMPSIEKWHKILRIGTLWSMYLKNILIFQPVPPNTRIAGLGRFGPVLVCNLTPLDLYYHDQIIDTIERPDLLGSADTPEISEKYQFFTPKNPDIEFCLALICCHPLRSAMPKMFEYLRPEILLAFIAYFEQANTAKKTPPLEGDDCKSDSGLRLFGETLAPKIESSLDALRKTILFKEIKFSGNSVKKMVDLAKGSLENWLGENVEEKDIREIAEIVEQLRSGGECSH